MFIIIIPKKKLMFDIKNNNHINYIYHRIKEMLKKIVMEEIASPLIRKK